VCDAEQAFRLTGTTAAKEQSLDGFDMAAVREEHDDVIVCLHHGVVVRDDHLMPAHDRA
jgi:hypothetical protein